MIGSDRMVLTLAACIICGVAGCSPNSRSVEEENKEIVLRGFAAVDAKDWATYGIVWADSAIAHQSDGSTVVGGRAIIDFEKSFAIAFPDANRTVEEMLADGDKVVANETFRGTYQAPLPGVEAPVLGQAVEFGAIIIYRIAAGQIVEAWVQLDNAHFVGQLQVGEEPSG